MKHIFIAVLFLLLAGCATEPSTTTGSDQPAPLVETLQAPVEPVSGGGQAAYKYLAALKGDWVVDGGDEGMFAWEFDTTSRESVIVERLKKGTPTEMTTIYDLEDDILTANHFCQLKNRPRLTLAAATEGEDLLFVCDGTLENAESHDDLHMHGVHFKKEGDSVVVWMDMFKDDEFAFETRYTLTKSE